MKSEIYVNADNTIGYLDERTDTVDNFENEKLQADNIDSTGSLVINTNEKSCGDLHSIIKYVPNCYECLK